MPFTLHYTQDFSRVVTTEEGKAFADKMGALFVECSAKRGSGVSGAFDELVNRVSWKLSRNRILRVVLPYDLSCPVPTFARRTDRLDPISLGSRDGTQAR